TLPGSHFHLFFLASHHTAESMIWASRALMTNIGGLFFFISIRPTAISSKGRLMTTNLSFGVVARQASGPDPKMISTWRFRSGSAALKLALILGFPMPKYAL